MAKEIFEYLGIPEDSDLETFKTSFNDKFIPKSEMPDEDKIKSSTVGKFTGHFNALAKKHFDLDSEELKKYDKWEDVFDAGIAKKNKQLEDLKLLSNQSNDGALKELNEKLERSNQTAREYKDANEAIKSAMEQQSTEWNGKLKATKADFIKKDSLFKIKDKVSETLSKGDQFLLQARIDELVIDFDEKDQPIALDKEGKRIQNPKKIGEFLDPIGAIELIIESEGFAKKNNASANSGFQQRKPEQSQQSNNQQRQIHPNAL